ncbi:Glutathione S-transferase L3 [Datura stramonium]|uniref:Glutathione S-transferase L3 n=1 Tax=Datura stramonium TaxID=4076 RepID=A0ABS8VN80_DATST|nr:Glutathione S-transferase L3 [Datura stramonium]
MNMSTPTHRERPNSNNDGRSKRKRTMEVSDDDFIPLPISLYISYICLFAQRAWITRNVKGLQDKIELVPIDLQNRPAWYKEKVYPQNKVPALEHNNKAIGESLI